MPREPATPEPAGRASGPIPGLPNLRDLGGWPTADGRTTRPGVIYRSADLTGLTADDLDLFRDLDIRTIYDLRSANERSERPDPTIPGVRQVDLDVLADAERTLTASIGAFFTDPKVVAEAAERFSRDAVLDRIQGTYRDLVSMSSARTAYRGFFLGLLGDDPAPAVVHCTAGKDRTGWAAASFLALMGVSRDDIDADYLLTNERLLPALGYVFDEFAAAGGDPDLLRPVLGVEPAYLDAAFGEVAERYGDIGGYFADGLGIGADEQNRLREMYLDRR
ncbi:tyrosine-protein phosphatase [Gordonia sinesedis]